MKTLPLGPTGRGVSIEIRRRRSALGLTYQALADRLAALNWPIPVLGLRRIEAAARRVTVDDLLALAVALECSPIELLNPGEDGSTALPEGITPDEVTAWARGETGLSTEERLDYWTHEISRVGGEIEEWDAFESSARNSAARKLAADRRTALYARLQVATVRAEELLHG